MVLDLNIWENTDFTEDAVPGRGPERGNKKPGLLCGLSSAMKTIAICHLVPSLETFKKQLKTWLSWRAFQTMSSMKPIET